SSVAQQGVPTVHRDVALVDIVSDEGAYDTLLYGDLSTGATSLYNAVSTATTPTDADLLLGATPTGYFDDLFDGAYNYDSSGYFLDLYALEDEVNQALGVSATTSETDILDDIAANPILLSGTDTLPAVGATGFDTDLTTLASDDYTTGSTDFTTYLDGLSSALTTVGSTDTSLGFTAALTELSTLYTADATALSTDFSAILTDLGSLF
ncbi:MAG: hypothetical protein WB777_07755, partial [Mycobacterium sp.]